MKIHKTRRNIPTNVLITAFMFVLATAVCFIFKKMQLSDAAIIMVYILGVLLTAVFTDHLAYSMVFSVISVLAFNFLFVEPVFSLEAQATEYPVTFLVMLIVAFITGSLAAQLKVQSGISERANSLAQKEKLRADLLRAISHDLRTPLTAISGNASNLLSNEEHIDDTERKQLYKDIYEDSLWLIDIVENLLAITRIEDGKMDMHISPQIMEEIIDEAMRFLERNKGNHSISVSYSEDMIIANADPRLIIQVITNIVGNAVKYTPDGTSIRINTQKINDMVCVSVADNGNGIDSETKEHVFEMFYSGNKHTTDSKRSLGLGLALCKTIIEAHNGKIWLEDNEPTGCVFKFTLPVGEVKYNE
ncbi:MAG: DUF4118 domain-containing protein [Firmicutes bacterium]|nr:DUF4118 domain-containing protein [Bacillota bacterium]